MTSLYVLNNICLRKMVISCCAYGCKETFIKGGPITFHGFPKDDGRQKQWEVQLRRENFKVTKYSKICSKHFTDDCFDRTKFGGTWLKSDAVPTLFNFPDHLQKTIKKRSPAKKQSLCSENESVDYHTEDIRAKRPTLKKRVLPSRNLPKTVCQLHFLKDDFEREVSAADSKKGITMPYKLQQIHLKKKGIPPTVSAAPEGNSHMKNIPVPKKRSSNTRPSEVRKGSRVTKKRKCDKTVIVDTSAEVTTYSPNFRSTYEEQQSADVINESRYIPEVVVKVENLEQENSNFVENLSTETGNNEKNEPCSKGENDVLSYIRKKFFTPVKFIPCKIDKREEIFGRFVACEMSNLCENPALYVKTKKIILNALIDAHFELTNTSL